FFSDVANQQRLCFSSDGKAELAAFNGHSCSYQIGAAKRSCGNTNSSITVCAETCSPAAKPVAEPKFELQRQACQTKSSLSGFRARRDRLRTAAHASARSIFRHAQRFAGSGERFSDPSRWLHAGRPACPLRVAHSDAKKLRCLARLLSESGIRRTNRG